MGLSFQEGGASRPMWRPEAVRTYLVEAGLVESVGKD